MCACLACCQLHTGLPRLTKWLCAALVGTAAAVSASASHILVKEEAKCKEMMATIEASGDVMGKFTELAKEHS